MNSLINLFCNLVGCKCCRNVLESGAMKRKNSNFYREPKPHEILLFGRLQKSLYISIIGVLTGQGVSLVHTRLWVQSPVGH